MRIGRLRSFAQARLPCLRGRIICTFAHTNQSPCRRPVCICQQRSIYRTMRFRKIGPGLRRPGAARGVSCLDIDPIILRVVNLVIAVIQ